MKRLPHFVVLFAYIVLLVSCKNGTTGLLIPKDAGMVVAINNSAISSKLSWNDIRQSNWFKDIYKKENDSFTQKLMNNPDSSGIDTKSNFAIFSRKQGNGAYFVFEGNLKDVAAFENMLKQVKPNEGIKTDGDIKYITVNGQSVLSWNGKKFMFLANAPYMNPPGIYGKNMGNMGNMGNMEDYGMHSISSDSLRLFSKDLFNLSSSNSIESDEHFTSLIKETGDIHLWVNSEQNGFAPGNGMFSMMKMGALFQGNVATGTVSFEEGKISMKWKQYYGKEMKAILDKYDYKPVTEDMINRIPSGNVVGVMAGNFPPDAFKEILKAAGFDGLVNGFMGKFNYSLDELIQAMKGQMVMALTDFSFNNRQVPVQGSNMTYPKTSADMKVFMAMSVNNKASFDKLLNIAKENIHDSSMWSKINYKINNDWFVIGNNPETVDGFLAGGNSHLPFASKISGHPFGAYFDIQKLLTGIQPSIKDSLAKEMMKASLAMWQDIVITGGDYKNGTSTVDMDIFLVDKTTNSLKQFNRYAEQLNGIRKNRPQPEYNTVTDSSAVALPSSGDLPSSTGR